jgi:hypothetical protein
MMKKGISMSHGLAACLAGLTILTLLSAVSVAADEKEQTMLNIEPYPHGFKVTHPDLPGEFIRWMVPEGYSYGEQHRGLSSRSFKKHGEGGWRFDSALEKGSIFRITLVPHEKYIEAEILLDNTKGEKTLPATSYGICSDFVSADSFWDKKAYERAYIIAEDELTCLKDTDRSESLNQEMPVYSVKGVQYPPDWPAIVKNGYGWALSETLADNSFICVASKDGTWVLGTHFDPVKSLSFNTKGARVHGCIHSNPELPEVPVGKVMTVRGRLYLMQGTPRDFEEAYERLHKNEKEPEK